MVAYKIVVNACLEKDKKGNLAIRSFLDPIYSGSIYYKIGEKTFPKQNHGPLTCFDSIESALASRMFNHINISNPLIKLFECDIEKSKKKAAYHPKKKGSWHQFKTKLEDLEKGTILADSVTLLSEIPIEDRRDLYWKIYFNKKDIK